MNEKKVRCLIYSRICGYYAPVYQSWNVGKQQEFKERRTYDVRRIVANAAEATEGAEA